MNTTHEPRKGPGTGGLALVLTAVGALAACHVDDDVFYGTSDLEVSWSIAGTMDPAFCFDLDFDGWIVRASGPELGEVALDCTDTPWTTGSSLYNLLEGSYLVSVTAVDFAGLVVSAQSIALDLFADGFVEILEFDFLPRDFAF